VILDLWRLWDRLAEPLISLLAGLACIVGRIPADRVAYRFAGGFSDPDVKFARLFAASATCA